MGDMKLGVIETRFAEIIWANAPLTTNQLIRLCAEKLEWKRTTTYTVLKNDNTADLYDALDFDAFEYDQWKLFFNADGQVVKAELQKKNYAEVIAKGADVMTIKVGEQSQQMSTLNAKFYAIDEINELVKAGKLSEVPLNDSTTYVVVSNNKASYVYYSVNKA